MSSRVSETLGFPHAIENDEVRSLEGQRCGKSRFGREFGLLWSTSWMLVMMERRGDGVNQSLLVLSNDLKSNSRPLAYFTKRKTRSRQFKFASSDLHSGCGGGLHSPIPKHPNRWTIRGPRIDLDLPLLRGGRKKGSLNSLFLITKQILDAFYPPY